VKTTSQPGAFGTLAIVKQRLRLASVSPRLHAVYADEGMRSTS
jgi:hypothetical protein